MIQILVKYKDFISNGLKTIISNRLKWINKKIKLNKKLSSDEIRYDETISLPTNWDYHEYYDSI